MQSLKHNPTEFAAHHSYVRHQQMLAARFIEGQEAVKALAAAKRKTIEYFRANRNFLLRKNPTLTSAQIAEQLLDHFLAVDRITHPTTQQGERT